MKEFFQNLHDKREEIGITLEEIHRRTYLPLNYLKDIEAGNLQSLPPGYDRIYLKRYAAEIGMDCNEVLRDYDMLSGRLIPHRPEVKSKPQASKRSDEDSDSAPETKQLSNIFPLRFAKLNLDKLYKYFWIFLAVVIIAITGFISYNQYIAEKQNQIIVRETPTSNISDNSATLNNVNFIDNRGKDSATERRPTPIADKKDSFVVRLKALDTTWVRQILDITDTTEYTLPTGLGHNVVAQKQVQFMVGKGDGVEFWLNGESLGIMGQADEVILSLIISEKGVVEKRLKKVAKKAKSKADSTVALIPVLY
jgi:cytoskeletal protein RodZ